MKIAIVADADLSKDVIFELGVQLHDTSFSFRWFSKLSLYAKESEIKSYDVLILPIAYDLSRFHHTLFQQSQIIIFLNSPNYRIKKVGKSTFIYFTNYQKDITKSLYLLKQCAKGNQYHLIHAQGMSMRIRLRDIYYMEKQEKQIIYHTRFGVFSERGTLKEKEEKWIEDGFVRIHHSILLNLHCVKQVKGDEVELWNQEYLPISRSRKATFKKELKTFQPE